MTFELHSLNQDITFWVSEMETLGLDSLNLDKALKLSSLRDGDP